MFEGQKIAVFDAEIKKPIDDLSDGWRSFDEMGVSCLVLFDYASGRYRVFDDSTIPEAVAILHTYDWVVGFNTVGFETTPGHVPRLRGVGGEPQKPRLRHSAANLDFSWCRS